MAIILFFVLATMRFMVAPLDRYDEGVTLTKAALTAAGQIPFRDYWITYGPLDTYILAAAFKVVAVNVLVERALGMVVLGLLVVASFSRPEFALALGIGLFAGYAAMGLNRQGLRARLLPYVLGAIGVAVGLWGVTVLMAGITPVWFDLVTYATSLYPQARRIPFG